VRAGWLIGRWSSPPNGLATKRQLDGELGRPRPRSAGPGEDGLRALARRARSVLPLLSRSKGFRRWALRKGVACVEDVALLTAELEPLDPPPCPVTIAWAEHDVGHVPMLDDPELVAETILAVTRAVSPPVAGGNR
jgi:hypothetical protein